MELTFFSFNGDYEALYVNDELYVESDYLSCTDVLGLLRRNAPVSVSKVEILDANEDQDDLVLDLGGAPRSLAQLLNAGEE